MNNHRHRPGVENPDAADVGSGRSPRTSWITLAAGMALWITVQGLVGLIPLWTRALPPEVDDSLAYLVRTVQWEGCFFQSCPALVSLRQQLTLPSPDPEIVRQRWLAAFAFPSYHPLFSLVLLALKGLTHDWLTAYKVLWSLMPILFAVALAGLLSSLWGKTAAGVALAIMALKVFPGNEVLYLNPSTLSLGMAMLLWARLFSRRGDAPWSLLLGGVVLAATHPLGGVYALLSIGAALLAARPHPPRRVWAAAAGLATLMFLALLLGSVVKKPIVFDVLGFISSALRVQYLGQTVVFNLTGVVPEIVRLKDGLFGFLPLFLLAVVVGFWSLSGSQRGIIIRFSGVYAVVLLLTLGHTALFCGPGDLFLRMLLPPLAILFGAVGQAVLVAVEGVVGVVKRGGARSWNKPDWETAWPLFLAAVLAGYLADMAVAGGEQLYATQQYMQNRQSLSFSPRQPELLLSRAAPGDQVLYIGYLPMAYYFTRGALHLGAVYYHPALERTQETQKWLSRPDLRFAVCYNPTVYHPRLAGLDEKDRCISHPQFHYSPLHAPRIYEPLNREGVIPVQDLWWMEVKPQEHMGLPLRLSLVNPGPAAEVQAFPLDREGRVIPGPATRLAVPARWSGWLTVPWAGEGAPGGVRLLFPLAPHQLSVAGVNWGETALHWPWGARADMVLQSKDPATGRVEVSFDASRLLPASLNSSKVKVLDDEGSAVLLQLE